MVTLGMVMVVMTEDSDDGNGDDGDDAEGDGGDDGCADGHGGWGLG